REERGGGAQQRAAGVEPELARDEKQQHAAAARKHDVGESVAERVRAEQRVVGCEREADHRTIEAARLEKKPAEIARALHAAVENPAEVVGDESVADRRTINDQEYGKRQREREPVQRRHGRQATTAVPVELAPGSQLASVRSMASKKHFKTKPLKDQVIVITGASSGIGLATARMAAGRGARVVLAARNAQ